MLSFGITFYPHTLFFWQGDSGGPLLVHDGTEYRVIGIASFANYECDPAKPPVYTKVATMRDWIDKTMGV